jgi:Protein of unknown function (DUF3016)
LSALADAGVECGFWTAHFKEIDMQLRSSFLSTGLLGLALGVASGAATAKGSVEVSFEKPAEFSDIGRNAFDRERAQKSLADHLQSLGAQLPDGQSLQVMVLDVDLAGELRHFGSNEVRVLRGRADAPHIKLRYKLQDTQTSESRVLKSGDATVSDLGYFFNTHATSDRYGDLPFEKRMLQQWFTNNFGAKAGAAQR